MSGRKNKPDLNISGFSPILLNVFSSPIRNTPAKNQAVIDAVNNEAENIISGYDRWKFAETNGLVCLNVIHNLREKSRTSSEPQSFTELENYCKKLKTIESIFGNIIQQITKIKSMMRMSANLSRPMLRDKDQTQGQILIIDDFLRRLISLYEDDLSIKKQVIENIAHACSSDQSHVLIASWYCHSGSNEINKLIMQLKVSSADSRWYV